jgi:hypothetical protein
MSRPPADIDPRAIAADFFRKLGGMEGMTKWGRTHRSLAYQLIAKLMAQPLVQNNVNIGNLNVDDQSARRKLADAFMREIEARKNSVGDPAAFHGGERIVDGHIIEHQPTAAPDSNSKNLKPPNSGSPFSRDGVATTPAGSTKNKNMYSIIPGLASGAALDGCDDNLSTTQRFLNWKGHGGPP